MNQIMCVKFRIEGCELELGLKIVDARDVISVGVVAIDRESERDWALIDMQRKPQCHRNLGADATPIPSTCPEN